MAQPTLDFSLYTHGNASQRQQVSSRLLDELSSHGFVKLIGHGISDERVSELFRWVSRSSPSESASSTVRCGEGKGGGGGGKYTGNVEKDLRSR